MSEQDFSDMRQPTLPPKRSVLGKLLIGYVMLSVFGGLAILIVVNQGKGDRPPAVQAHVAAAAEPVAAPKEEELPDISEPPSFKAFNDFKSAAREYIALAKAVHNSGSEQCKSALWVTDYQFLEVIGNPAIKVNNVLAEIEADREKDLAKMNADVAAYCGTQEPAVCRGGLWSRHHADRTGYEQAITPELQQRTAVVQASLGGLRSRANQLCPSIQQ